MPASSCSAVSPAAATLPTTGRLTWPAVSITRVEISVSEAETSCGMEICTTSPAASLYSSVFGTRSSGVGWVYSTLVSEACSITSILLRMGMAVGVVSK